MEIETTIKVGRQEVDDPDTPWARGKYDRDCALGTSIFFYKPTVVTMQKEESKETGCKARCCGCLSLIWNTCCKGPILNGTVYGVPYMPYQSK